MRFGVLGDIHGNYEALAACHAALQDEGCDLVVALGDIVGYGPHPRECVDFIRERAIPCVRGNHDHYTALGKRNWPVQDYARTAIWWSHDQLDTEHLNWLGNLPFVIESGDLLFVHASMDAVDGEFWPYVLDSKTAMFHFYHQHCQLAFFGHTHIPLVFSHHGGASVSIEILRDKWELPCDRSGSHFLINPGSVGQPRDYDWRACAAVVDTELNVVSLLRVEYDVRKTRNDIIAAGLPECLAERLSRGN